MLQPPLERFSNNHKVNLQVFRPRNTYAQRHAYVHTYDRQFTKINVAKFSAIFSVARSILNEAKLSSASSVLPGCSQITPSLPNRQCNIFDMIKHPTCNTSSYGQHATNNDGIFAIHYS